MAHQKERDENRKRYNEKYGENVTARIGRADLTRPEWRTFLENALMPISRNFYDDIISAESCKTFDRDRKDYPAIASAGLAVGQVVKDSVDKRASFGLSESLSFRRLMLQSLDMELEKIVKMVF